MLKFFLGVSLGILFSYTKSLGCSASLLLAPAEGWGALQPFLGHVAPSLVAGGIKQNILSLVSK